MAARFGLELIIGFGIGMALSLLGGGGSILTVPALVYLAGQSPQAAVATSLAIVAANSTLGAWFHSRQGRTRWAVAGVFGGAGMIAAYLAAGLSARFSERALMLAFAVLMLAVGALMLLRRDAPPDASHRSPNWSVVLASGIGVGLLTGVLGVGGGFLIVPALVMLVGLPMSQAVGTSLVVIALNSLAGLAGHLGGDWIQAGFDPALTLIFVTAGLVGTLTGANLAHRLPADRLRKMFGGFVILLGILLLADHLI